MAVRAKPIPHDRDEVITLARYGAISKDEAEAAAASNGWRPFEYRPPLPQFDPSRESRWSLIMAIAWIAWRDLDLVRENWAEFRAKSTIWIFEEWIGPNENGSKQVKHAGWFLKQLSPRTVVHLSLIDLLGTQEEGEPLSARGMPVAKAEMDLWRNLSDGRLVGEAINTQGAPTIVLATEWSFLKLYEERGMDVLKFRPLDPVPAYMEVRFKREDLISLWPPIRCEVASMNDHPIEPYMIEPVARKGEQGYVPLCSAIQWIMTAGGSKRVMIDDPDAWDFACDQLMPFIESEDIQLIGTPRAGLPETIPGHTVSSIKVLRPLSNALEDTTLDAPSHILCTPYVDREHWTKDFNDKLYERWGIGPTWTHLQVLKAPIIQRWRRAESNAKPEHLCLQWLLAEIEASPDVRRKSKRAYQADAKEKFPTLADRQFHRAWDTAISQTGARAWSKPGPVRTR